MSERAFKVLLVFGTRPEAIKLALVLRELQASERIEPVVCVSAQHDELLDQALDVFSIKPDYSLDVMTYDQSLFHITRVVLERIEPVLKAERPDLILVQGDANTAFAGALAGYYCKIPVAHVEAGLRTHDKYAPFPEEMNRCLIDRLAELLFAPTEVARENLLSEGIAKDAIFVTGNTEIDALYFVRDRVPPRERFDFRRASPQGKIILVTAHRRESFAGGIARICQALRDLARRNNDVTIVYAVHPNPNVREVVQSELAKQERIVLLDPPDYASFVRLMEESALILTDSGGIQEAGAALHIPLLVLRNKTDRVEGIKAGAARLVGTDPGRIVFEAECLLRDSQACEKMMGAENPYGDGNAAVRIAKIIEERYL
jgi:UDP-N-acetylglucosamine 2-epimerase (non-hydrolysing)